MKRKTSTDYVSTAITENVRNEGFIVDTDSESVIGDEISCEISKSCHPTNSHISL